MPFFLIPALSSLGGMLTLFLVGTALRKVVTFFGLAIIGYNLALVGEEFVLDLLDSIVGQMHYDAFFWLDYLGALDGIRFYVSGMFGAYGIRATLGLNKVLAVGQDVGGDQ